MSDFSVVESRAADAVRLAEKMNVETVVTFSGCPGGSPEDKTPNWVTCPWPDDFSEILKYQWDEVLIPYWKKTAAWAAERFVCGGGDDVGVLHGIVKESCGNQSCGVRHVHHEECADLVSDGAHPLVVPLAAVGRTASDDEFRFVLQCQALHFIVVHASRFRAEVVAHGVIEDAGGVDGGAM